MKIRALRGLFYTFLFVLAFVCADTLIFRIGFWNLPNETAWETEPFYNFEYKMYHLRNKPADEYRVVIAGSSLGLYGLLPEEIETRLNQSGALGAKRIRVFLVGHQGMHGVELAALTKRYLALKPDAIILPMNMVDLRLERPVLMGLMEKLKNQTRPDALRALYQDLLEMYGV
ncbi:MAG: hypothetical protein K8S54_10745 [Spirochaetia bacterium]|nr:hypothetical protein [Spirochaetia bacterium]